jgi:hypothetical protein
LTSDFGRTWGLCFFISPPGEKAAVLVATGEGLKFLPGNPGVIIFDARKNPVGLFVFFPLRRGPKHGEKTPEITFPFLAGRRFGGVRDPG